MSDQRVVIEYNDGIARRFMLAAIVWGLVGMLADEIATTAARRLGVFVREYDLWARIGRVRKIIFDKTGTLTFETPSLANPEALRSINGAARRALFALVRDSLHPVSRCLHETLLVWGGEGKPLAGELTEETGFGVSLRAETARLDARPGRLARAARR